MHNMSASIKSSSSSASKSSLRAKLRAGRARRAATSLPDVDSTTPLDGSTVGREPDVSGEYGGGP